MGTSVAWNGPQKEPSQSARSGVLSPDAPVDVPLQRARGDNKKAECSINAVADHIKVEVGGTGKCPYMNGDA